MKLVPDSASRPSIGRPAALDVHVISPLQSARTQGHALQVGVQRKLASNLRSMGLTCIPLVAETLGGLAEDYHPQINWSSVRWRGRQNHNQTPLWKGEHSLYAHPHLDIYFLNK